MKDRFGNEFRLGATVAYAVRSKNGVELKTGRIEKIVNELSQWDDEVIKLYVRIDDTKWKLSLCKCIEQCIVISK